jgi:hypothetical protein
VRLRSRVAATAVALPLILGLAACGPEKADNNSAGGATSTTPPASTPVVTPTAEPQKVVPAVTHLDTASFLPAMKKGMAGKNTVRVKMQMTAGGQNISMSAEQSMKPVAMKVDMSGAAVGGKMKLILVKNTAYVSTPDVPAGKYVKVDPKELGLEEMLADLDPASTFDAFDGGLKKVTFVKTETVDGRKVDRYAATVDMKAAMKAAGEKMPAGAPKTLVYTIWMGSADHLMYKVAFEMAGAKMTMTASDWGKPVSIKAPPASAIVSR